jgi:hypothetical protein
VVDERVFNQGVAVALVLFIEAHLEGFQADQLTCELFFFF